jgi:4-carboxymuconolactone decarboxylase
MDDELYARGLATRREVLGADYVERALAGADDFTRPLQEFVTRHAWGDIWNRPGLGRRERSLVNLALLTALNRPHELSLHVRGALRNGVTIDEIREVLLHAAVYCGVPASMDAFRVARQALDEAAAAQD